MNQQDIIDRSCALKSQPGLRALFLGGSFGAGLNDSFSDVDLVALVDPKEAQQIANSWCEIISKLDPVIHQIRRPAGVLLVNLVTQSWQRADLHLRASVDNSGYTQDGLRVLYDPENILATLPKTRSNPDRNSRLIQITNEFLRVLGLLPVGLGRGEMVVAASGVYHLQTQLIALFTLQTNAPHPGGALHLSRLISSEQMDILSALPSPAPRRKEIIAANLAYADAFLPKAHELAVEIGADWPKEFLEKTADHLAKKVSTEFASLKDA